MSVFVVQRFASWAEWRAATWKANHRLRMPNGYQWLGNVVAYALMHSPLWRPR